MLMITEFSNNSKDVSETDKANQYVQYYKSLRNEPNMGMAFAFALNWPGQDRNREGWVFKDSETKVAGIVGTALQAGI